MGRRWTWGRSTRAFRDSGSREMDWIPTEFYSTLRTSDILEGRQYRDWPRNGTQSDFIYSSPSRRLYEKEEASAKLADNRFSMTMKRGSIDWKIIDRETKIARIHRGSIENGEKKYMAGSNRQACIRKLETAYFTGRRIRRPVAKNRARRKLVGAWNIGGDSAERSREKFDTGWTKLSSPFSVSFGGKSVNFDHLARFNRWV